MTILGDAAVLLCFVRDLVEDPNIKLCNPEQEPHIAAFQAGLLSGYRARAIALLAELGEDGKVQAIEIDARRYRYLRKRDLDTIAKGGVFAGKTPANVVLNGSDLDAAVDAALAGAK